MIFLSFKESKTLLIFRSISIIIFILLHLRHQQEKSIRNMQMNSGLTRYRSAPSSFFNSFLDGTTPTTAAASDGFTTDDFDKLFNPRASSPETKQLFASFMNNSGPAAQRKAAATASNAQLPPRVKKEPGAQQQPRTPLKRQQSSDYGSTLAKMNRGPIGSNQAKAEGGSGLRRQSSAPVGLFDNIINIGHEYTATADGNFRAAAATNVAVKSEMGFVEDKPGDNSQFDDDGFGNIDAFLKELAEEDDALFLSDDTKSKDGGKKPSNPLSRHQSLPADFNAMEKLLQDSVPCKLRAKRGCATHPRSIAERVRRTKISERMRKLQDLVPNMEKQTNTADMLDLAVDYIKDLQRQLQVLSQMRGNCSCEARLIS